jgi:glycosyltransferase involved in cell wall biosynthesis
MVLPLSHGGAEAARNAGISAATGEFIYLIDSDDLVAPNGLNILLENAAPDLIVEGQTVDFISEDLDSDSASKIKLRVEPYLGGTSGSLLIPRILFERVGMLDANLRATGGMMDWIMRAKAAGISVRQVESVVARRRMHFDNMGRHRKAEQFADYATILRRHLGKIS